MCFFPNFMTSVIVNSGIHPVYSYCRAWPVPYAHRPNILVEMDGIVPVVNITGTVSILGDYEVTVNTVLNIGDYLPPKMKEIFANYLGGGAYFSLTELKNAYLQMDRQTDSQTKC